MWTNEIGGRTDGWNRCGKCGENLNDKKCFVHYLIIHNDSREFETTERKVEKKNIFFRFDIAI